MKLTLEINLDNAAFEDGNAPSEAARILARAAQDLAGSDMAPGWSRTLRDINGNKVGTLEIEE